MMMTSANVQTPSTQITMSTQKLNGKQQKNLDLLKKGEKNGAKRKAYKRNT
jgi:hypothetical protein